MTPNQLLVFHCPGHKRIGYQFWSSITTLLVIDYQMSRNCCLQFGDNLSEGLSSRSTSTEITEAGSQIEVIWIGRLYVESANLLGAMRNEWNKQRNESIQYLLAMSFTTNPNLRLILLPSVILVALSHLQFPKLPSSLSLRVCHRIFLCALAIVSALIRDCYWANLIWLILIAQSALKRSKSSLHAELRPFTLSIPLRLRQS